MCPSHRHWALHKVGVQLTHTSLCLFRSSWALNLSHVSSGRRVSLGLFYDRHVKDALSHTPVGLHTCVSITKESVQPRSSLSFPFRNESTERVIIVNLQSHFCLHHPRTPHTVEPSKIREPSGKGPAPFTAPSLMSKHRSGHSVVHITSVSPRSLQLCPHHVCSMIHHGGPAEGGPSSPSIWQAPWIQVPTAGLS